MESSRRELLKGTAFGLGSFVLGFYTSAPTQLWAQAPQASLPPPQAFIVISPDNAVSIVINKLEMGQGVNTSMAQLIAEELACDWSSIRSIAAPVDPVYNHTSMPLQMTGGSTSLASSWQQYRQVGATMREMLREAAAQRWKVPLSECTAVDGHIVHKSKGKLTYGDLAAEASRLPQPKNVALKASRDFKIIGQSKARVDSRDKVNGSAVFGMDVRIPDMVYAVIAHPPLPQSKIKQVDESAARAITGVIDVQRFGERVAVLARNTHLAKKGRDALQITYDVTEVPIDAASLLLQFQSAASPSAPLAEARGNTEGAMGGAEQFVEAEYVFPFLAHAAMEPLNVTIHFDGKTAEIWSGHQMPGIDREAAAKTLGLKPAQVTINTVYAGGSFGRRASKTSDYVVIACELAKQVKRPLKVVWTREDDMQAGYYRPMALHRVKLGMKNRSLLAWNHEIACQSIMKGGPFEAFMIKNGIEDAAVEGIAKTHYAFDTFRCTQALPDTPFTTLWWRSVGHTHTAFVMETMLDELAVASGQDPFALRRQLLKKSPRHLAVLDLLEKQSEWKKLRKASHKKVGYGLALHESFNTVVGQVVEVALDGTSKMPRVSRVWAAVHCGKVVNPEGARSQVEGGIAFGLSAALYQAVEIDKGQIKSANFDNYPVLRMAEMPKVTVAFVETEDPPTGLGEPGVPPIGPALANAYFALTQKRIRKLPFSSSVDA